MARIRNPRYAPELLEKRLSPSSGLEVLPAAQVYVYSAAAGDPPPPPPQPGDPLDFPPVPPGGP